jgi:1-acyl-sn-glycerol-3-phosphate acyltransferase
MKQGRLFWHSMWAWIVLVLGTLCITPILLLVWASTFWWDRQRFWCGILFRRLAVYTSACTGLWRFKWLGYIPYPLEQPYIIIANHQSDLDSFFLARLPWEMKWMAKSSLFWVPFLGWNLRLAGDIPVSRGQKDSIVQALRRAKAYLHMGMSVFFFPEGRRSQTGEILPFKEGAFRLALETKVSILPIAILGTAEGWQKNHFLLAPVEAVGKVGDPISVEHLTLDDLPKLMEQARQEIQRMAAQLAKVAETGAKSA